MKKIFALMSLLLAVGSAPCLFAEEAAEPETAVTGDAEPILAEDDLNNTISNYINEHQDILDPQKCQVFSGVADISIKAGQKGYALARVTAYHKAFLSARQAFAQWLETEVTSSMESIASEGMGLAAAENDVQKTINDAMIESLKNQATAKGIDVNDKAAFEKFMKENIIGSASFKQQVGVAGNSFQQGLMVYKSFANGEQVGVIAVFNQRNLSAAKALRSGVDNGLRGKAKTTLLSQVPKDAKTLANTFGCRILRNENGEYCIIGYGHGVAASKSQMSKSNARKKADLQAIDEIKQFAGEQIAFSEAQEITEASGELADGTLLSSNSESFQSAAKMKASSLKINGAKPIASNMITLPSGETIVVTVTAWVPGDAMRAKSVAKEMLVGKDDKNQGNSQAAAKRAPEKSGPQSQKVEQTTLKSVSTVGESDVADLD